MTDPVRGVNPTDTSGVGATGAPSGGPTANQASQPQAAPATDSADVTQAEALLAAIGSVAGSVPGVDQAKVGQIQQAIAAGTYQANPQAIAEKLLEIERLLGGGTAQGQ